jgi:SAM-dependent methyltransferase
MGGQDRSGDAQVLIRPATRIANELHFHDAQARDRAEAFRREPYKLLFDDATYLDHESWIRPATQQLGELNGRQVLDYGCGHGMAAIVFARMGAHVTGIDLSAGYLAEARARAQANCVHVRHLQADAEHLPFADHSFDRIWGNAVLHHLDIRQAASDIRRVLKPGGVAVFCEPWGSNRLLAWARNRWHYQAKHRTPDEQPLREPDIRLLQSVFPALEIQGCQLVSMIRRVIKQRRVISALDRLDHYLLGELPSLQRYCRYIILTLKR